MVNQLAGSKKQLKKRIERIATFTVESKLLKLKSILIFLLLSVVVAIQIPIASAMPNGDDRSNFENKQTVYEDLGAFFNGYDGTFKSMLVQFIQDEDLSDNDIKGLRSILENKQNKE